MFAWQGERAPGIEPPQSPSTRFRNHRRKVMDMRLRGILSAAALSLFLVAVCLAQTTPARPGGAVGRISGKVYEKGKDPAAFVNVIVLGTKQGTQTDDNGAFSIPGVPVGTVQVQ